MGRRGKHAARKPTGRNAARKPTVRNSARNQTAWKHAARKPRVRRGSAALVTVAVASTAVAAGAGVAIADSGHVRTTILNWADAPYTHHSVSQTTATVAARNAGHAGRQLATTSAATSKTPAPLVLTARDYRMCPATATACVDLTRHLTWLQSDGKVSFGPVRMEPGPPGTANATPTGTFKVIWKGGPNVMSNTYHEPMPWAVFFAPGGIAFHAGSLTVASHGCVHLTMANAHYYNEHLSIGAEVVVF
jgi:L,D-transpeptidase catalytic domain